MQHKTPPSPCKLAKSLPIFSVASLSLFTALSLLSTNTLAEIYKWKDESGQVHYSATPPPTKTIDLENISDTIAFQNGAASQQTVDKNTSTPHNNTSQKDSGQQKGQTNNKGKYCDHQTQALKTLRDNEFVKWKNGDEDVILEGEMKAAKISQLSQDIEKYCSPTNASGSTANTQNEAG